MSVSPVDVQRHLKGVSYPAEREELVECAQDESAPDEVVEAIQNLGQDSFDGPDDVMAALGETSTLGGNGNGDGGDGDGGDGNGDDEDVGA